MSTSSDAMKPRTSFSDLLVQLIAAHESEVRSAREECDVMLASANEQLDSLRMRVADDARADTQEKSYSRQSTPNHACFPNNLALDASNDSPDAEVSPSHDSEPNLKRSGSSNNTTGQMKSISSHSFLVLSERWAREKIWGADDVTLPETHGTTAFEEGVISMFNGIEARVTGCLGCDRCVMFPNSNFRTFWDIASLFLIIGDILTLPFLFAFDPEPSEALTVIEWISLIFWTTDMAQGPFLGYFANGDYISNRSQVFKHYLKTWFIVDVIVVGPEWLSVALRGGDGTVDAVAGLGKLVKSIRVMRVLRLLRLPKIKRLVEVLYDTSKNEFSFALLSVIHLIAFVLLLNHLVACAWYAVGKSPGKYENSWILDLERDSRAEVSLYYLYLTSLHWSLTQFTPAAMKVSATNELERLFSIIVLFFAMIVFSSFVGSITNHITKLRSLRGDSTKQLWLLRRFLKEHKVTVNLAQRIHKFVEHKLSEEAGKVRITEIDILSKLSSALSDELAYDLHSKYVCVHPFFNSFSNEIEVVMHRICRGVLQALHSAKDELLFTAGEEGKHMYIVQSGELEYHHVGNDTILLYPAGDFDYDSRAPTVQWVAEAVLWTPWRHRGKLVVGSSKPSEFLTLNPEQFFQVMNKHPRSWLYATVYGEHFVGYLNSLDHLTDIICDKSFYYEATKDAAWVASNPWKIGTNTRSSNVLRSQFTTESFKIGSEGNNQQREEVNPDTEKVDLKMQKSTCAI